jgi:hypothetical protein
VARKLFMLIFFATITVFLGTGYYKSFRSGVLTTVRYGASRRDRQPIAYRLRMLVGALAFLVMASVTALMAFLVCMDLFGR